MIDRSWGYYDEEQETNPREAGPAQRRCCAGRAPRYEHAPAHVGRWTTRRSPRDVKERPTCAGSGHPEGGPETYPEGERRSGIGRRPPRAMRRIYVSRADVRPPKARRHPLALGEAVHRRRFPRGPTSSRTPSPTTSRRAHVRRGAAADRLHRHPRGGNTELQAQV